MRPNFLRTMKGATALTVAVSLGTMCSVTPIANAQNKSSPPIRIFSGSDAPQLLSLLRGFDPNRAVIGVTLDGDSGADTAGIRLEDVDASGPAAKAGLKAGDFITEINGVNLKISQIDAEDPALFGISQRRLQRAMASVKVGDEVTLRVRSGSASKSVTLKSVSAADLSGQDNRMAGMIAPNSDRRGAIGVSIDATGNSRDTLGLFISSVIAGGPAEKAGIVEGERIASINGVDVRVPKEDAKDGMAASARVNRFVKAIQDAGLGGTVALRVYSGGRYREVSVPIVKASDLDDEPVFLRRDGGVEPRIRIRQRSPAGVEDVIVPRVLPRRALTIL